MEALQVHNSSALSLIRLAFLFLYIWIAEPFASLQENSYNSVHVAGGMTKVFTVHYYM